MGGHGAASLGMPELRAPLMSAFAESFTRGPAAALPARLGLEDPRDRLADARLVGDDPPPSRALARKEIDETRTIRGTQSGSGGY
jgi:hypothetical protein